MVALIAIDGELEPPNRPEYDTVYGDSFMRRLVSGWQSSGGARYIRGPNGVTRSLAYAAHRALEPALDLARRAGVSGLVLAGYSKGGAAAIVLSQLLAKHDVQVTCRPCSTPWTWTGRSGPASVPTCC
jgi:hypothetical protein